MSSQRDAARPAGPKVARAGHTSPGRVQGNGKAPASPVWSAQIKPPTSRLAKSNRRADRSDDDWAMPPKGVSAEDRSKLVDVTCSLEAHDLSGVDTVNGRCEFRTSAARARNAARRSQVAPMCDACCHTLRCVPLTSSLLFARVRLMRNFVIARWLRRQRS